MECNEIFKLGLWKSLFTHQKLDQKEYLMHMIWNYEQYQQTGLISELFTSPFHDSAL